MKILLTGSEGFIGQHLKSFLKDKHQLICLDKKTALSCLYFFCFAYYSKIRSLAAPVHFDRQQSNNSILAGISSFGTHAAHAAT